MKAYKKIRIKKELQWNLVMKRLDITKPSYNKVILLVPALYIYGSFHEVGYTKCDMRVKISK